MDRRHDAATGALLGTFLGDALGAPWEGRQAAPGRAAPDRVRRSLAHAPLAYTDDTQLALALAAHLCEHPRVEPAALVATILEHFEPWRGYGGGMLGLVDQWRRGVPPEVAATAIFPEGSFGNGAAMRVAPVAALWWHQPDTLADVARRQAQVTHAHPLGMDGAVLQARAVGRAAAAGAFGAADLRALADDAASATLRDGLERAAALADVWHEDPDLTFPEVASQLGNDVTAARSVPAALWAAAVADGADEVLELALGVGGDADTIAAMAGAVAGAAVGAAGLPEDWVARLENGPRGRRYARALAERIATRP